MDEENAAYDAESEASEDNEQTRKVRGYLGSFVPRLGPSNNGPSGKEWTCLDFIVDGGASDSTLPAGVLPDIPIGPPIGFKEFAMADGRIVSNLGSKVCRNRQLHCSRHAQAAYQCWQDDLNGTFSVHGSEGRSHPA